MLIVLLISVFSMGHVYTVSACVDTAVCDANVVGLLELDREFRMCTLAESLEAA